MRKPRFAKYPLGRLAGTGDVLTRREWDVLRQICDGSTNKRIAQVLGVSPETVKSHVTHILLKLGVSNRAQAAYHAKSLGLLESHRQTMPRRMSWPIVGTGPGAR